jgi:hypothetical protein
MSLLEQLRILVERLQSLPKVLQDLTAAISAAAKANGKKDNFNNKIFAEIRFPEDIERQRRTEQKTQTTVQKTIAAGTWAAFLAASIYARISYLQWQEMHKQTIEANRAWIDVSPVARVLPDGKVVIDIQYINTGKGAARFLHWNVITGTVNASPNDTSKILTPKNTTCDGLNPDPNGSFSFPFMEAKDFRNITPFRRTPTDISFDEWTGMGALWAEGCLAYQTTSGRIGKTKFCSVFFVGADRATGTAQDCALGGIGAE